MFVHECSTQIFELKESVTRCPLGVSLKPLTVYIHVENETITLWY